MAEAISLSTDEIINRLSRENALLRFECQERARREDTLAARIEQLLSKDEPMADPVEKKGK